jgi:hypothetical protein
MAACHPKSDDQAANAQECGKATAALRSCMQAVGDVYDSYLRDTDKQGEESS